MAESVNAESRVATLERCDKQIAKNERHMARWWNKPFNFILRPDHENLIYQRNRLAMAMRQLGELD